MTPNQQLRRPVAVDKADMELSDLTSGGRLKPEQLKQYIRVAIKKSVLMSMVRVTTIPTPEYELPKMTTLGEVMHPLVSGAALAESERSKVGLDYVQLAAKGGKAEVDIPREVLEDQIERGAFKGSIMAYLGEHTSRDLENQMINGDTTGSGTAWIKLQNGAIARTTTNTSSEGGVTLDKDVLRNLDEAMPEEFDEQPNMAYFTNRYARNSYRQYISDRTGGLSDAIIDGTAKKELGYQDRPIKKIPLFPNNLGTGTDETRVMLLSPKNLIYAFYRKVTLDTEFAVRAQKYIIVLTLRSAIQFEHEPAVAMSDEVLGQ
jgi:hypothetical protein